MDDFGHSRTSTWMGMNIPIPIAAILGGLRAIDQMLEMSPDEFSAFCNRLRRLRMEREILTRKEFRQKRRGIYADLFADALDRDHVAADVEDAK